MRFLAYAFAFLKTIAQDIYYKRSIIKAAHETVYGIAAF